MPAIMGRILGDTESFPLSGQRVEVEIPGALYLTVLNPPADYTLFVNPRRIGLTGAKGFTAEDIKTLKLFRFDSPPSSNEFYIFPQPFQGKQYGSISGNFEAYIQALGEEKPTQPISFNITFASIQPPSISIKSKSPLNPDTDYDDLSRSIGWGISNPERERLSKLAKGSSIGGAVYYALLMSPNEHYPLEFSGERGLRRNCISDILALLDTGMLEGFVEEGRWFVGLTEEGRWAREHALKVAREHKLIVRA